MSVQQARVRSCLTKPSVPGCAGPALEDMSRKVISMEAMSRDRKGRNGRSPDGAVFAC
jgi:hypothetical protein